MSTTMGDVIYETYIEDGFNDYHRMISELGNCDTAKEFRSKLKAINSLMTDNPLVFGENAHFVSPAIIENIEAVRLIQKNWKQQAKDRAEDRATNKRYFWLQLAISFLLGILATYCYERFIV